MSPIDPFATFVDVLSSAIAAKLLGALAPPPPARVYRADAVEAGAPSWRWITEQDIEIRGPRGARYVLATELAALLERTSIRRRTIVKPALAAGGSIHRDARSAVVDLASRRMRGAA